MRETLTELENRCKTARKKVKEELKVVIERCYEVKDNISVQELELIWFIRKSSHFHLFKYYKIAKKFYEAEVEYNELVGLIKSEVNK